MISLLLLAKLLRLLDLHFKVENIKIVPGTYEVKISKKLLSEFKSSEYDLTYYIALEPDVTWED